MALKNKHMFGLTTLVALGVFVLFTHNSAFGAGTSETEPEIKASDELKKNPLIMKVLKNIEISKKKIAEMQKKQLAINEHKKLLETQRKIANEKFQNDLVRMNKDTADFTPRASYSKFLSGVSETYHGIFWGQFNYHEQKAKLARMAMDNILNNGGSYEEAKKAYSKIGSMTRTEITALLKDLNIQHGFASEDVQKHFDKYGKLPRTED